MNSSPFWRVRVRAAVICWLFGVIAAGCQAAVPVVALGQQGPFAPAAPGTPTFTPFQAVKSTITPSLTPTPTLTLTPTLPPTATSVPCSADPGRIEQMQEQLVDGLPPLNFSIYFPPCFSQQNGYRYPVLYMIHGQTFSDDQWQRLGIGQAADALIKAKKAPPFLIVMPRENDTYADIYLSSFSRNVTDGLVAWVDTHYPTCAERACRAIGGLSRGGAWALHLGFTHSQLFGAVGLHSTPPFNTDPGLFPSWIKKIPSDQMPRVYMDIGRGDPFLSMASDFEAELLRYNVPHEWYLNNGKHEEAYWSAHVTEYLEWYASLWNNLAP